ncbi:MAG: arginine--tRNA ligase [Geminicoccaceae bacterium]|jgi:arginyl-tRNA synthetase|nr:arginine--tRNA ligase [Geminicoccaceae bacterium]MCB9969341.1 arginine--tRNA ligase [Geminicoccaceae bacterium]
MDPFDTLLLAVQAALRRLVAAGRLPEGLPLDRITVEPPRERGHGDAATNAALTLAKAARMKPLAIAEALAEELAGEAVLASVEAVPPGFVNMHFEPSFVQAQIGAILAAGDDYGRSTVGQGQKVNVEFCSANPTGPLHVGHGRGTVFGDALAALLAHAGFEVTREYYVNDGGAQIEILARSIHHRYLEALGDHPGPVPQGLYPLEELLPVARAIAERDGGHWRHRLEQEWLDPFGREGVAWMLRRIKDDLAALGVEHDVFTSERALVEAGRVDAALARLEQLGLLYTGTLPPPKGKPVEDWEPVPQLLFRATAYGDDVDRPLKRSTGAWTYFAADLAYHLDKLERGFPLMIDVWGADHGGYVKRLQAAVQALSQGAGRLEVRLCQLVNLLDGGKPLKMSKRAGRIVTLRDVIDEVGKDVFRFIMLTRKNDAALDFDLAKVVEQSKDNPVFYVQYAHARICSVLRNAEAEGQGSRLAEPGEAALERLVDPAEMTLVKTAAFFPRVVVNAALQQEPHRVAFFLHELASDFHALWTRGNEDAGLRFLKTGEPELSRARLAMLRAVRQVLANGLRIMGVTPVAEMH